MKSAIYCEHANESPVTRPCRCSADCYCKGEGSCRPYRAEEEWADQMARSGRAAIVIAGDGAVITAKPKQQQNEAALREVAFLRAQLDAIERRLLDRQ